MIDISGDVIYFQGKAVGIITVPNGSLRGEFEAALDSHVDIKEEIESIMEDYTPREDIQEFFSDITSGELNMSDEIDNMCKKLSAIYELKCWW